MEKRKAVGLILGPLLFLLVLTLPILGGQPAARRVLAVFLLTVVWWITESLPIPVTALLIPVLLTAMGVARPEEALAPMANPVIFLFLGSFILARALSVHGLDRRLANTVLAWRSVGYRKPRVLLAFGVITACLSLWLSNTATTAMMFPIALGILAAMEPGRERAASTPFAVSLMLMIAYASSVGGIGTPVGSPPNLITIGLMKELAGVRITFFQWMAVAFLVLVPMMAALYIFLRLRMGRSQPPPATAVPAPAPEAPGKLTRPQKNVLLAFGLTVLLWVLPGFAALIFGSECPTVLWFQKNLPESSAALIGACLLFLLPVDLRKGRFTLSLGDALQVDWGTLLLFGGGLTLGTQMFKSGLAGAIGSSFLSLGGKSVGLPLLILMTVVLGIYLTEVVSNTAAATMIIPIVIAVCRASELDPAGPVIAAGLACSFGFMMPMGTPPNAIVYCSGLVPFPQMIKAGFWLDLFGIVFIWLGVCLFAPLLGLL